MTWRGSITASDRIFACLPYLLPLISCLGFAAPLVSQFPVVGLLFLPILPIAAIYQGVPFLSLAIFFALFLLVVRNESIARFIRFNTMQAILFDIVLALCSIVISYVLRPILPGGLLMDTLYNVIFLGTLAAVGYSLVQTAMGKYAEIPTISDAVNTQIP
ncbi:MULTISPECIES: Tic20 family protein [unclassified Leptolyngbya]|uniref:Tic20 family protein n=1 Tax=unclassified Leptolyngbya TaxID=2650499 RepID=UPI001687A029|nr:MULTISPECIES: Tic20 family protein [unclassified Leptolyngbya]MBD1912986.1 hypothetical protein [Leptolyngbya sp. FACHB-8]MBD2155703.1 hypothetical protein [Leptolyngbya sp. FACHB-16]